jgi:hypothetical protein
VASLKTLASTRNVTVVSQGIGGLGLDRDEEILLRTSQEPVDQTLVLGRRKTYETIFTAVDALDLELLPRLDAILPAELRRENDLAFGGNGSLHGM